MAHCADEIAAVAAACAEVVQKESELSIAEAAKLAAEIELAACEGQHSPPPPP